MTADEVIRVASECLNTPFLHQGRVIGRGMDCAGVLVHCFKRLGVPFNDEMGYPRNPYDGQLDKILAAQPSLRAISKSEMQAGDVLSMRIKTAPQHIAIHAGQVRGHDYIIHGSSEHGKVCIHRLCDVWGARVMRVYRFEGME